MPDFEARLRAVSLRVTRPRLAVLGALRDHPHIDAETVIALVRVGHPTVSHQAVYDALRAFTDAGLVRRIQPAGATARYESRVEDNAPSSVAGRGPGVGGWLSGRARLRDRAR